MAQTPRAARWISMGTLAVPLLLSGCRYGSGHESNQVPDCDGVLAGALQCVRVDDTSGATDSKFQWLTENCAVEYDILVDSPRNEA